MAFYAFDAIAKVKPYKDGYRERLDAIPLADDEQQQVVAEVRATFGLNQSLFTELSSELQSFLR